NGQAALVQVSAHRYLQDRGSLSGMGVSSIPAMHGPAAPIARGWVLALVTPDATRQVAAAELMAQLLSPEVNAAWNQAAGYLPTGTAAMPMWCTNDSYARFVDWQLQAARPRPALPNYTQVAAALQEAVVSILNDTATADQADAKAVGP